jgi:lysyl-tRNA synthetase class 2
LRGRIKSALRAHFEARGFTEVECGALQASPGNEAHLHAFRTELIGPDAIRETLYLHTSPEFACKKLLAAGERKIFEFARVFRNREQGPLHAPEFTMLEWYRADGPYEDVQQDCLEILKRAAAEAGRRHFSFRGRDCDVMAEADRISVAEAIRLYAGIDLIQTLSPNGQGDRNHLATLARRAGVDVAPNDGWSDIFSKILVSRIEPRLGLSRPAILHAYPRCEAALARSMPDDPRFAERFELYVSGVELANGFGELTDAAEQRSRFVVEMDEKERVHGERYPLDEDFLAALSQMPPASGVALGFDRLVMLAAGAPRIADVMWTPLH